MSHPSSREHDPECRASNFSIGFGEGSRCNVVGRCPNGARRPVDYCLWALQRHYERGEDRYIELIWDRVVEIEDLDRIEVGRKGVVYNKKRPLIVDQGASK